jgi:hypothetical protein
MRLSVLFADMCTMLPALAVYVFVVQVRAHKSLSAKVSARFVRTFTCRLLFAECVHGRTTRLPRSHADG